MIVSHKGIVKNHHYVIPLLFLFSLAHFDSATIPSSSSSSFSPDVNYLIDCGSSNHTKLKDGRIFESDRATTSLLSTTEDIQILADSIDIKVSSFVPSSSLPLYQTARVFREESNYTFFISKTGRIWVRLYFFPLPDPSYNLRDAVFSVETEYFVLLHEFSVKNNDSLIFKEYLIDVPSSRFSLNFKPKKKSFAFINAIEVVSAPDTLILDSATAISSPLGEQFKGLLKSNLQVSYRVNVGGPTITPENDALFRTWEPDGSYNVFPQGFKSVVVPNNSINGVGVTPLIAPNMVYETCASMKDPKVMQPNFNLSWMMNVEKSYSYLIRMHFCDIVSKKLHQLYFNVYINEIKGVAALDLSTETKALATPFFKDFVLNSSAITNGSILVQVGPSNLQQGMVNAILNGIEVMKMSNSAGSFDGLFSVDGDYKGRSSATTKVLKIAAFIGLGLAIITILLLVLVCMQWKKKRTQGMQKRNNLLSWIPPFRSACKKTKRMIPTKSSATRAFRPHKNKNRHSGRFFPLSELQQATENFNEKRVIGVGGFGNVYLGTFKDGEKMAIKRGNGNSDQGINEFRTELNMLSKLRHKHLVSLMGFCDENSEMILVYEYMANGPFRSHLYGSDHHLHAPLSWQQRLQICIGAARGLYYLHTGATQSIIHRDVKTTNILLDENYVAKVSDFGLSKIVPEKAQVSTAVKGSFGYLDPEYYMTQQLTQKSDIYSFGVVLFEVLCARPVICPTLPTEQVILSEWAMKQHKRGLLHKMVDPYIVDTISPQSFKEFVHIAEKCLANHGANRPTTGEVLWHLEYALQLQQGESHEGRSTNNIMLNHYDENVEDHLGGHTSDDASDSTNVDSALFSQIANFQGR